MYKARIDESKIDVDPRSLIFFRLCFAALMLVYAAGRCTDFAFESQDYESYSNVLNVPFPISAARCPFPLNHLRLLMEGYPWLAGSSEMYWRGLHAPLLLLCAGGMVFCFGPLSRVFYAAFAILKLASVFRDIMAYNNHEYLYSSLALLFSLLGGFDLRYSVLWGVHRVISCGSILKVSIICFGALGLVYMMLRNAISGIADEVAPIGMLSVWMALVVLLSETDQNKPLKLSLVPVWNIWIVRAVICSVYMFAALAKTDSDWLSGSTASELLKNWTGSRASPFIDMIRSTEHIRGALDKVFGSFSFKFEKIFGDAIVQRGINLLTKKIPV